MHMVPRKGGDWRPCGDYRALNKNTVPNRCPWPTIHGVTVNLYGATMFPMIDLDRAYHQLTDAKEDILKTAVEVSSAAFWSLRCGTVISAIHGRRHTLVSICFFCVDDILVGSSSPEEPTALPPFFCTNSAHGTVINMTKREWGVPTLDFLGHHLGAIGIQLLSDKVNVIGKFSPPTLVTKLRQFIGLVNIYRRFISNCAELFRNLDALLCRRRRSNEWFPLPNAADQVFSDIKHAIANVTILLHPKHNALTCITTDTYNTAFRAVLQQRHGGPREPSAFFSKKLKPCEMGYSVFGRELLAINLAICHFRHFFEGRSSTF